MIEPCKAPAKKISQHARALVEQHGAHDARQQLGGVLSQSDTNASRHLRSVVNRFRLDLRVPISTFVYEEQGDTVVMPYFRPGDFLKTLMESHSDLLLGGHVLGSIAATRMLDVFWQNYSLEHTTHPVVGMPRDLQKLHIPLMLHGDGGRTQKKQPLEIVSLEPVIGVDTCSGLKSQCSCRETMQVGGDKARDPATQRLNCRHNSYLQKFLLFAYPSKHYPKMPGLLCALHKLICQQLAAVCATGIVVNERRYFFGIIGYKGDFEWHAKLVEYTRNYSHLGRVREIGCCPECAAGSPGVPFEDISTHAVWTTTICQDLPWRSPPPVTDIGFDDWHTLPSQAARFFRRDPFHVFRHGLLGS